MCDFWRITPTVGASVETPLRGHISLLYQPRYSSASSKTLGARGCQIPFSAMSEGGAIFSSSMSSSPLMPLTYLLAIMSRKFSRLSSEPPSQYWRESRKDRPSCAIPAGRNLRTVGRVRSSLRRFSSKVAGLALLAALKNSLTLEDFFSTGLPSAALSPPTPRPAKLNSPSLLSFMTSGMEGKQRTASRLSRAGFTASTTFSARSWTKIREPMKTLASATSFLKAS
mmetsp:Transcript_22440/g.45045  ORF Transcript_22440/g.45045 Transcript_22440/m.45045 type:complete len:226 (+) Transcript_22440:3844-4521(+)